MTARRNCARCLFRVRKAVDACHFSIEGVPFEIPLCAEHKRKFEGEMNGWAALATMLDAPPLARQKLSTFNDEHAERIRVLREREHERRQAGAVVVPKITPRATVSAADDWHFTKHAQQRAKERGFTPEEVLRAAVDPETVYQRLRYETACHARRDCFVIVNPATRMIVTVMDKFGFTLSEKENYSNARQSA